MTHFDPELAGVQPEPMCCTHNVGEIHPVEQPQTAQTLDDYFQMPGNHEDTIFEGLDDLSACLLMNENPR